MNKDYMNKNYLNRGSITLIILSTIWALIFLLLSINTSLDGGMFIALVAQHFIYSFFTLNLILAIIYLTGQKNNDDDKKLTFYLQIISLLSLILVLIITIIYNVNYKNRNYNMNFTIPTILCILILLNTILFSLLFILKAKKVR